MSRHVVIEDRLGEDSTVVLFYEDNAIKHMRVYDKMDTEAELGIAVYNFIKKFEVPIEAST